MSDALNSTLGQPRTLAADAPWAAVGRHAVLIAQLCLAALVVYLYAIEGTAFFRLFVLATAAFVVNLALPLTFRLPFFVAVSIAGAFVVFSPLDALWLFGCGGVLIGLCHLPVSYAWRVVLLVVAGSLLAVARAGLVGVPWSAAVWPILGAMFMFRIALYLLAISRPDHKKERGVWWALGYFFMLPNLVFPLFPVIDFQTMRRTYYDRAETGIYEQGMLWIARGLVHLLLYRFVYHHVLNDPADVVRLSDLVQFMLGTFLLYLRVSGQFHLIVGLLHLFGFRLPETHKLYYLAHSFTELWRRINIYWTEFMMKTVFYPTYFRVKRLGPSGSLVTATVAVFLTTWVLHSYQWFWLRGGFPLTLQDTLFWGVLGLLVVLGALKESKRAKRIKTGVHAWDWKLGLRAALTFSAFCFLWSLWSTESVDEWVWMLGAAFRVDLIGVGLVVGVFGTVWLLGGRDWSAAGAPAPGSGWMRMLVQPGVRASLLLLLLLALAPQALQARVPPRVAAGLAALHATGLNTRDAALQHRGYYEQLEVRPQANEAANRTGHRTEQWDDLASIGVLHERKDVLLRDLHPSRTAVWNGHRFSTNAFGMRDGEYTLEKPAGTLRIALLGPSHVMGNGVGDGGTFEALLEQRLNREAKPSGYLRVEILNFGVDGYCLTQQVAMLEDRVLAFAPDVVIATHYGRNRLMTERYLVRMAAEDIQVPFPELQALLARSGLVPMDRGKVPVPFAGLRSLARQVGVDPRMPGSEASARARSIADETLDWSFDRFATLARTRGFRPAVLALNAVIDDVPGDVPNRVAIERNGLPIFDLFDIFPEAERPRLRVAPWDDHPNDEAHRRIADRLYGHLVPFLEGRSGSESLR